MSHPFREAVLQEDAPAAAGGDKDDRVPRTHARNIVPGTAAASFNPTVRKFRRNVSQLLSIESATEQAHTKSCEALVHAGKMAVVGRMVAGVNHEIKRPLASMELFIGHLRDLILCDEKEAALHTVDLLAASAGQLNELSRQLEDFSRKNPLNKTTVAVQAAIEHVRKVLTPKIRTGQHALHVDTGDLCVIADMDRLTLAIVNLVDNALDATAGMQDKRIDIDAQRDGATVVIRVRDRGPGIPDDIMERLFEAFFTTKPEGKGLGLGLALSAEVLADMDGRLAVRNHPEGGCEFSIRLPAAGEA